jgi:hypothetical protein
MSWKVREMLGAARDFARADLLLVLIAARQLATLDAGTPIADLITASAKIGRSETWGALSPRQPSSPTGHIDFRRSKMPSPHVGWRHH